MPASTPTPPSPPAGPPRPLSSRIDPMYILLLMVVLTVAGYFLVMKMKRMSDIQDCVMAGRRNCAPLDVDPP